MPDNLVTVTPPLLPAIADLALRTMRSCDLPPVLELIRSDARAGHYTAASLRDDLRPSFAEVLTVAIAGDSMPGPYGQRYRIAARVGLVAGSLASYAFVRSVVGSPEVVELWMFGVASAFRGQGLGRRMLDQVLADPACAGAAIIARCHRLSGIMLGMLRHRRFSVFGDDHQPMRLATRGVSATTLRGLS